MTIYSFPLHDTQDYKGRIIFTAVRENYKTLVNTAIGVASDANRLAFSRE